MSYTQLTALERMHLYQHIQQGLSQNQIARQLKRSASTISRELKRNPTPEVGYLPDTAHRLMQQRRSSAKKPFISFSTACLSEVKQRLEQFHSPEQITGRLAYEGHKIISHETIYQMIYANHAGLGSYATYLRHHQGKRHKRIAVKKKHGPIPNRVGIEERPTIADLKTEIGHWEGDTVIGAHHEGALVTQVDKASKYLVAALLWTKTAEELNRTLIKSFRKIPPTKRKTFTFDNGGEFSGHGVLTAILGVLCFFARPYHSWERGLNEHTNGLLRQFFPKKTNFRTIKKEELAHVVEIINHRPRKELGYKTPHEVFWAESGTVALHP